MGLEEFHQPAFLHRMIWAEPAVGVFPPQASRWQVLGGTALNMFEQSRGTAPPLSVPEIGGKATRSLPHCSVLREESVAETSVLKSSHFAVTMRPDRENQFIESLR